MFKRPKQMFSNLRRALQHLINKRAGQVAKRTWIIFGHLVYWTKVSILNF